MGGWRMGGWCLNLPNTVRILKSVGNIGWPLSGDDNCFAFLFQLRQLIFSVCLPSFCQCVLSRLEILTINQSTVFASDCNQLLLLERPDVRDD